MNLSTRIEGTLAAPLLAACRRLGEMASDHGEHLYLVGGAVRDLVLERPFREIDLVLVGDVARLAREAVEMQLARQVAASLFMTVKLDVAGHEVDLVTARRESYPQPGSLPVVVAADLDADLRRRDFSVNALAASLSAEEFGEVTDLHDGLDDLKTGTLRALYGETFRDDATRVIRAARYTARLGMTLDTETEGWLRRDAHYLGTISPDRLRHEMDRIWGEGRPEQVLDLLWEWGALAHLHSGLSWDATLREAFQQARTERPLYMRFAMLYPTILASRMGPEQGEELIAAFNLPPAQSDAIRDATRLSRDIIPQLEKSTGAVEIDDLLAGFSPTAVLACTLTAMEPESGILRRYLEEIRDVQPALSGNDLLSLGVPQGPLVGEYLQRLRTTRLEGAVTSGEGERELVRRWLSQRPDSPA